jgi:hypothetical protein
MAIAEDGPRSGGLLTGELVSIFLPIVRRSRALERLGATRRPTTSAAPARVTPMVPLIATLLALAGILMAVATVLLIGLSIALSGLFTVLPTALLHALLRGVNA